MSNSYTEITDKPVHKLGRIDSDESSLSSDVLLCLAGGQICCGFLNLRSFLRHLFTLVVETVAVST